MTSIPPIGLVVGIGGWAKAQWDVRARERAVTAREAAAAEIERRFALLGRFDEEVSNSQTKGVEMAVPELATGRWRTRELWLHGRSEHTQSAYRTDAGSFLAFVRQPLRTVTVGDVQAWMDTLDYLAPGSRARKISSVKSLFGFGHRLGYLPFDVGRVVKRPKLKDHVRTELGPDAQTAGRCRKSSILEIDGCGYSRRGGCAARAARRCGQPGPGAIRPAPEP